MTRRGGLGRRRPAVRSDRDGRFARGLTSVKALELARGLLAGEITLAPHGSAPLDHPPDWASDPFGEPNWRFQFHTLRWAQALKRAYDETDDASFLHRYEDILRDWHERNPRATRLPEEPWGRHSTALRARVYAAYAEALSGRWPDWLRPALAQHADALTDPEIYARWGGNQGLDQNVGLFAVASVLGDTGRVETAITRTAKILRHCVDVEGTANEQATEYQIHNYRRYNEAVRLFDDGRRELPAVFDRVERMPDLIAYATQPDGRRVLIGDTVDAPSRSVPGTIAEFAVSGGEAGPRPPARVKVFRRGYLFVRSGWGGERDPRDEALLVVRFGPRRLHHGHHDATAVSLYACGQRVIPNAGKYAYTADDFREYVRSPRAQNAVTFPDAEFDPYGTSELLWVWDGEALVAAKVRDNHYPGVDYERTVVFEHETATLVTVDRFADRTGSPVTAEQRFRLDPSFEVDRVEPDRVVAAAEGGPCVVVQQLGAVDEVRLARGELDPYDGWVSYHYGERQPTNVVVSSLTAVDGWFVTAIRCDPSASEPADAGVLLNADGEVVRFASGRSFHLEPER
jgi:hypothetical protein